MKIQFAPVTANKPHDPFSALKDALNGANTSREILRAGFAYATLGGVQHFSSHVEPIENWKRIPKQFLIGIHHGITEPSAIDTLINIDNSEIRIFVPGNKLVAYALIAKPLFHPKVLAISGLDGSNLKFVQAGSANLTSSAIGDHPQNYEFSVAIRSERVPEIDRKSLFSTWWSNVWAKSRIVDKGFIQKYADIRKEALDQNPILRFATEAPPSIGKAEFFFSEVGAGSGPPGQRHQIEFPESLARFFGQVKRHRRDIALRKNGKLWSGRPLSYKRTTFGVEIWRLGMPTQNAGGEPIAERAIRYRRTANPDIFEFKVVDVDSRAFDTWVKLANMSGHIGATHGQRTRQYGFY